MARYTIKNINYFRCNMIMSRNSLNNITACSIEYYFFKVLSLPI